MTDAALRPMFALTWAASSRSLLGEYLGVAFDLEQARRFYQWAPDGARLACVAVPRAAFASSLADAIHFFDGRSA